MCKRPKAHQIIKPANWKYPILSSAHVNRLNQTSVFTCQVCFNGALMGLIASNKYGASVAKELRTEITMITLTSPLDTAYLQLIRRAPSTQQVNRLTESFVLSYLINN